MDNGELAWFVLLLPKALLVVFEALKDDLERRTEPDDLEMRDCGDMAAFVWFKANSAFSEIRLWFRLLSVGLDFAFKLDLYYKKNFIYLYIAFKHY